METWKTLEDFPGYEISNLGNIKSLSRVILRNGKYPIISKEKLLYQRQSADGYKQVALCKDAKVHTIKVHQLVAMAFLNHKRCSFKLVVNHIDNNKLNNNLDNLEIITNRQNSNHKHLNVSSQYVGVSKGKNEKKWQAHIFIKGKDNYLGRFINEIDASNAYQAALKQFLDTEEDETLTEEKLKEYEQQ
jgi:hypothetical protein